jgi:hypothetical protein
MVISVERARVGGPPVRLVTRLALMSRSVTLPRGASSQSFETGVLTLARKVDVTVALFASCVILDRSIDLDRQHPVMLL